MAETSPAAPETRRHSTRIKQEPLYKRREKTPPPAPKETPKPKPESKRKQPNQYTYRQTETPKQDSSVEGLATKILESKALPTLDAPQHVETLGEEFQTLEESGVLAAALARSRRKWVHEGVLAKFWTKAPPKRKLQALEGTPQPEPPPPPKKPGKSIGTC